MVNWLSVAKPQPTRRADMVAVIESRLSGISLRRLWEDLDELQRLAVSEAPHDAEGFEAARFIEEDSTTALQPAVVPKLQRILSFLQDIEREDELLLVPGWKAHRLVGDRKDVWSLRVTKNWRITFRIDRAAEEIVDLDYEDYH